jgi:hypothetical protein
VHGGTIAAVKSPVACVALIALVGAACATTSGGKPEPAAATAAPAAAAPDYVSFAAPLAGYRWELPCQNKDAASYKVGDTCPWDPALLARGTAEAPWKLKIEDIKTFGGDPAVVYQVTLRFRGISEPKNYQDGTLIGDHFYVGGTEKRDDYNIYSIKVSDPPRTYHLTRHEKKTGHFTFKFDYTAPVEIRGGAQVVLGTYDHNTQAIANGEQHVVDGIAPAPQPYAGHFVQMDVVSVKPLP